MTVHSNLTDTRRAHVVLRTPGTDLRFIAAYSAAADLQYFVDRIRSALDTAPTPHMGVAAVERAELTWKTTGAEVRRRLRTRMAPAQRQLFEDVDVLLDQPGLLSANPAAAAYFARLWLGSAVSSRIALAKLHGPEQFGAALVAAMRVLRDHVERRWMTEQVKFLERYPWIDREAVIIAVDGASDEAATPVVVVTMMDSLP